MSTLEIKNLHVSIEDKEILKGLNLKMSTGEIHAIIGLTVQGNQRYLKQSWAILLMK